MAKKITITILDTEDIKKITAETMTEDSITATHYNNIKNIIEMLTAEKKAYDEALIAKHGHETFKNDIISISCYDSKILDTDSLIEDIGKQKYEEHKTKSRRTEKVIRFGK